MIWNLENSLKRRFCLRLRELQHFRTLGQKIVLKITEIKATRWRRTEKKGNLRTKFIYLFFSFFRKLNGKEISTRIWQKNSIAVASDVKRFQNRVCHSCSNNDLDFNLTGEKRFLSFFSLSYYYFSFLLLLLASKWLLFLCWRNHLPTLCLFTSRDVLK